jgi:C1A family cysteine protease
MNKRLLVVALLVATAVVVAAQEDAAPPEEEAALAAQWKAWQKRWGRLYSSQAEHDLRFNIFIANLASADRLNAEHEGTATFGATKFSDLSVEEFRARILTNMSNAEHTQWFESPAASVVRHPSAHDRKRLGAAAPASVDWRATRCAPIRQQGSCGSCWAFSIAAEIEGRWLATHTRPSGWYLAPQQLLDCDNANEGCGGGYPSTAIAYIKASGGLTTETLYKYAERRNSCKLTAAMSRPFPLGSAQVLAPASYSWADITQFVADHGPTSAALDASQLQSYTSGIFAPRTWGADATHAVNIVGYGTSSGQQYFRVRNSWGADFGESGYFRMKPGVAFISSNYVVGSN